MCRTGSVDRGTQDSLKGRKAADKSSESSIWRSFSAVLVEAAAGLAAERALRDQALDQLRHRDVDLGPDRARDIEADQIEQCKRTHRVSGAELHAGIDVGRDHAAAL